jgi:dipeptidyl aminopeptidase/acylaminoacyl peptidase
MKISRVAVSAIVVLCFFLSFGAAIGAAQQSFTIEQIMSAPFAESLIAAKEGNRIAWTINQQGRRNIFVAEGPDFAARQLTSYGEDDGQELGEMSFDPTGATIVYTRGEGKNASGEYANPTSNPAGVQQTVWAVTFSGGAPKKIDEGHSPKASKSGWVAYARGAQIYLVNLRGDDKPKQVVVRGHNEPLGWSPDGGRLLFVSSRGDHSFIGIYDAQSQSVHFLTPTVDSDSDAVWSLDGRRVAFVRQPAVPRDTPLGYFIEPDRSHPWAIWVADAASGDGKEVWKSETTKLAGYPYMAGETGGGTLHWEAGETIVFAGEQDGYQHLYAVSADGGAAKLLTPGNCEVEQWSFSADDKTVLFNSNCKDVDRRHTWRVGVQGGNAEQLSQGFGIEWAPVVLSDGKSMAYIGATVTDTGRVFVVKESGGKPLPLGPDVWAKDFSAKDLVAPEAVTFKSADGVEIHGQLFLPKSLKAGDRHAALIFMHGGPIRQMLLSRHYMYYYSNSYGMNQYLASRGYVVLSVNYRSGIGYGRAFREADGRAGRGASEYQDIVAAGKYLDARGDVDAKRVGLWGGSYGGYLTALGLARNSDMFAAGVDFHGVHDWPTDNWDGKNLKPEMTKLAHDSSPVASVDTWTSPVLFIHGDDDRNVYFAQTVDLIARLRAKGVHVEQLVFPDDVHDFLLYRNWVKAYTATSNFFDRELHMNGAQ